MSNLRTGINVSRRIGAGGGANISEEMRQVRTQGTAPFLHSAVVVDVVYDPSILTEEERTALEEQVANPRVASNMPRNSIVARIVSSAHDVGDSRPRIIYPLFPSHFGLPIKAGEQVFIIYPDPHTDGSELGYWITRIPEPATVEDLNYTHGDRRYDYNLNPAIQSTSERAENNNSNSQEVPLPNFPNGAGTPETLSLFVAGPNDRPYETIFSGSKANKQITFEAVPRFVKRPADFALIGSNNTRLVLGEDRTGPATRGEATIDKRGKAGAIDLVAGYGSPRFLPENRDDDPLETNPDKRPTAPHITDNTRNFKEIDKAPFRRQKQDNPREGDTDFKRDLSRVYVAMKTAGDKNFEVKLGGSDGIFPDSGDKLNSAIEDLPDGDEDGQPFIVLKSEYLRFIASGKDKENNYGGPRQHGDIRIVKEGNEEDHDLGMLVINRLGEVIAVGRNIQLYTHEEGKVFIRCKNDQTDEADPAILFTKFDELMTEVKAKMESLRDGFADQFLQFFNQTTTVPNATTPFGPVPAIVAMKALAAATSNQMKAINVDFTSKIDPCKSKWVFISKESQSG